MVTPVEMYFPSERLAELVAIRENFQRTTPNHSKDPLSIIASYTKLYGKDEHYGFLDHLAYDSYSPTWDERVKLNMATFNCTQVIQPVYHIMQSYDFEPEIVQFLGFRNVREKKSETEPLEDEHFALIVKAKRKGAVREFLVDPTQHVCGEIVEKTDTYWKIKHNTNYKAVRREFQAVLYYTQEEYAQLLYDMRDDAKSLDMLVAGQKIRRDMEVRKANSSLMVYYDGEENVLTTRLYIPQVGITDKAIDCVQFLNDNGEVQQETLTLSLAKSHTWKRLTGERRVAVTDYSTLQRVRALIGRRVLLHTQPRIGPILVEEARSNDRSALSTLAEELYGSLNADQQSVLRSLVLLRTLYEAEAPAQEYVFDETKRNERINKLMEEDTQYRDKIDEVNDTLWEHSWGFAKIPRSQAQWLARKKQALERKRNDLKFGDLNSLRRYNKHAYHRTMDKVLFAQQYEGASVTDLESVVETQGLDWRMGYIAMVADFIPYAFQARKELELQLFMEGIQRRVRARRALFAK